MNTYSFKIGDIFATVKKFYRALNTSHREKTSRRVLGPKRTIYFSLQSSQFHSMYCEHIYIINFLFYEFVGTFIQSPDFKGRVFFFFFHAFFHISACSLVQQFETFTTRAKLFYDIE